MVRGQETAAPEAGENRLIRVLAAALGNKDDVSGQVLVHAAKAVGNPRAHAGGAGELRAGVDEGDAGVVVDGLGMHGADYGDIIGHARGVGQEVADPLATGAALLELGQALADGKIFLTGGHACEALALSDGIGEILTVDFFQVWLVVEEIDVGWTARLEKVDDALRLWGEMGGCGNAAAADQRFRIGGKK